MRWFVELVFDTVKQCLIFVLGFIFITVSFPLFLLYLCVFSDVLEKERGSYVDDDNS